MIREQAPLRVRLGESPTLNLYRHLLHAVLAASSLAAAIAHPLEMFLPIGCLTLSWYLLFRHRGTPTETQVTLLWRPDGSWLIERDGGGPRTYRTFSSCFSSPWLTILGFRRGLLSRRYYLILGDNCDPDQHRRLRVRLREPVTRTAPGVGNYPVSGP